MKQRRPSAPGFIEPQLCELVSQPPHGRDWIHEVKFDGYRMQLHVSEHDVRLYTRRGFDWSDKFPALVDAAGGLESCILDGELCAVGANGVADFPELLTRLDSRRSQPLVLFAFDCLRRKGKDLRSIPLLQRKRHLQEVLREEPPNIRYVAHLSDTGGHDLLIAACRSSLEGVVSKIATSPYRSGKSGSWLKSKCRPAQEVVIGGWTEERSGGFRSLLVGVYEEGRLVYAGKVGTGFNAKTAGDLRTKLEGLETPHSPFAAPKPTSSAHIRWVKPKLVAQIEFAGWTGDRQVRQASFKGIRQDKAATSVVRERETAQ